ncbi:MAG: phenylacetate--CoA ligase family protein [Phycisphaerae bacterium]
MQRAWSRKNLWENAPPWVRSAVGAVARHVPLAWLLGARFRAARRFVRAAQHWSADEAQAWQYARLCALLTAARERSRFYRERFRDVGFEPGDFKHLDDLRRLPMIDKHTLRARAEEMCVRSPSSTGVDYVSTGGTSGVPLQFYIDAGRSAVEYAYLTAGWERVGFRLGMPTAVFRSRVVEPDCSGLRHVRDPLTRQHFYSNFHMSDDNVRRYLAHVATLGPCFIHCYPSSAAALARCIERLGLTALRNVRGLLAGSENVYPEERARIEAVFGVRYCSWYGHSEKLVLGAECEHSADYHLWPTYGYCELIDVRGNPVTQPGKRGEIVGTGFMNRVMPFIRYRTGDFATLVAERCDACGRAHRMLRDVRGHRIQEVLIAADGTELSWVALNMHDDTFDHVRQFQFYQDAPGVAVLRIVPAAGFGDEHRERILRVLDSKCDGRMTITIEMWNEIPLSPRGKAIYVDQRIDTSRRIPEDEPELSAAL